MFGRPQTVIGLTGLTLAAILTACSSSPTSTTTPTTASLTASQADTAAAVLTADADGLSDGATSTGSTNVANGFALMPVSGQVRTMSNPPLLCHPTITPQPVVNRDGDAVPDSERVDFTGCLINSAFAPESLGGTIDYIDPTPTVTDHNVKRVFTNFFIQKRRILRGDTIMDEWNGTQTASRDSAQGHFADTVTLVHTFPNGTTASHAVQWLSTFVADTAGQIQDDTPLPSGLRSINGLSTWTWETKTWDFSVSTNPPGLHRNDTCTTVPLFDSGTMTVVVTRPSETTTLTITFTGCGVYTVTRS